MSLAVEPVVEVAEQAPFAREFSKTNLTQRQFAELAGASPSAVCRWLDGSRRPPSKAYAVLAQLLAPSPLSLRAEHDSWLAERERRAPAITLEVSDLPEGMSPAQARELALAVIRRALARATGARREAER